MVITIENLIEALNVSSDSDKVDMLSKMILESIASVTDNFIMTDLMMEMLHRNAALNHQLESKIQEVERLSVTDQLTGAFNRRKFTNVLEIEIDRNNRYETSFSLIMFDIDHFKSINDTYGHDIGDFVLKELSRLIKTRIRVSDTFARWGGEEFMILAPETNIKQALILAENIRSSIEMNNFSPVKNLTCSFGVVSSQAKDFNTLSNLTKAVDVALYEAKKNGRNQAVNYHDIEL